MYIGRAPNTRVTGYGEVYTHDGAQKTDTKKRATLNVALELGK